VPGRTERTVLDVRVRLVGLSERAPLYAMVVPLATVQRLHRLFGRSDPGYLQVTLLAATPTDAPALAAAVRRMGFGVDASQRATAERVGTVVAVTTGALAALALVMSALAALAIARSRAGSVAARAREFALLQALGATPGDIAAVVVLEAALLGLVGGLSGVILGRLGGVGGDAVGRLLLPDFPYRPETFFQFPAWLLASGLILACVSAILGSLAPAASAARVDPARMLS
jgi:putative ABC transport system permease protein